MRLLLACRSLRELQLVDVGVDPQGKHAARIKARSPRTLAPAPFTRHARAPAARVDICLAQAARRPYQVVVIQ